MIEKYIDTSLAFMEKHKAYLMYFGGIEKAIYNVEIHPEMIVPFEMNEFESLPPTATFIQQNNDGLMINRIDKNAHLWKAIDSDVTAQDIEELEAECQIKLPEDYKAFLKYKYFYQLVYALDIRLYAKPKGSWKDILTTKNKASREYDLAPDHYFVIGEFSDYAYIALNTVSGKVEMLDWALFTLEPLADSFSALLEMALATQEATIK